MPHTSSLSGFLSGRDLDEDIMRQNGVWDQSFPAPPSWEGLAPLHLIRVAIVSACVLLVKVPCSISAADELRPNRDSIPKRLRVVRRGSRTGGLRCVSRLKRGVRPR